MKVHPCDMDHMHTWKLEPLGDHGWYCTEVWTAVKPPVLKGLAQLVADVKNEILADSRSQFLAALHAEQSPIWLEAARNHEAKKDLYGNYRNYTAMVSAIQDLNRGRG